MSEWISVKDRLPDDGQDVWYYFKITDVNIGKYDAERNCFYNDKGWLCGDVIYWQPCNAPLPPNE
jgi:hypothetical protein